MRKRFIALAGLGLLAAFLLAACAPKAAPSPTATSAPAKASPTSPPPQPSPTAAPPEPVVLRVGITFEPDTFHPFMMATGWRFADLVFEGFVGWGLDCEITPRLAESMEQSEDGLTWTIHLRPGITYNDGQPLDANALKESWDWPASTELAAWFPPTREAQSWEVVDDLTFRFTTNVPIGAWANYDALKADPNVTVVEEPPA